MGALPLSSELSSKNGRAPSTAYTCTVVAIDGAGNESAQSTSAEATNPAAGSADTTAPTSPTDLTATAVSASEVDLAWTGSSDTGSGVEGYALYRDGTFIGTLVGTTSFADTARSASTTYAYTVSALDGAANESTQSSPASATTDADGLAAAVAYDYDTAGRLVTIAPVAGSAATFGFDALGRIATRTVGSASDTYSYRGASRSVVRIAGSTTTDAIVAPDGSRLGLTVDGTTNWYLFDLHGDVAGQLSSAGSIVSADRYDPYGQVIATYSGGLASPWRYQGALDLNDGASPLYALGARTYAPSLGAWTQADSLAGSPVDPPSMNRFLYAEANPTTLVDPTGRYAQVGEDICPSCLPSTRPTSTVKSGGSTPVYKPGAGLTVRRPAPNLALDADRVAQPTYTINVFNKLLLAPDGTMVDHDQYELPSSACQSVGRPPPALAGGPCDAWWKTTDTLSGGKPEAGVFLPGAVLEAAREKLKAAQEVLWSRGSVDLRIGYVLNGGYGDGALVQEGEWSWDTSRALGKLGKAAGALGVGPDAAHEYQQRLNDDRSLRLDPMVRQGRALLQSVLVAGSGWALGLGSTFGCEFATGGVGTLGCVAVGVAGYQVGSAVAEGFVNGFLGADENTQP